MRRVIVFLVCIILLLELCVPVNGQESRKPVLHGKPVDVYLNGKLLEWGDAVPFINDVGRTMIPARFFSEAIGGQVMWSQEEKKVTISLPGQDYKDFKQITLQAGTLTATVVDYLGKTTTVTLDSTVWQELNSPWRTFVPFRFVSECAGCIVNWTPTGGQSKIFPDLSLMTNETADHKYLLFPDEKFHGKVLERDEVTIVHFLPLQEENDYLIVPGERIGKFRLDWPVEQYCKIFEALEPSETYEDELNHIIFSNGGVYEKKIGVVIGSFDFFKGGEEIGGMVAITSQGREIIELSTEEQRYHTKEGHTREGFGSESFGVGVGAFVEKEKLKEELISAFGNPLILSSRDGERLIFTKIQFDLVEQIGWRYESGKGSVRQKEYCITAIHVFNDLYLSRFK